MKKYIWLGVATGLAILAIFGIRRMTTVKEVEVTLVTIEPQTIRQTVTCTGKVEASESRAVYAEIPCVAKEVYVKEGQTVRKGAPLFSVDVEATQAALSQMVGTIGSALPEIKQTQITAPVSGVVSSLDVRAGEVLDHQKPCATISGGKGVQITVAIRERHLPQVHIGQEVVVTGVAFSKKQYSGVVTEIASVAHQQYIGSASETVVDAVITLKESMVDSSLRTGLNAQAVIVTDVHENCMVVPYECVTQTDEGEECVYVYRENGIAERQILQVAGEFAEGILVVSGISSGERLVQNPDALSGERATVREK